MGGGLSGRVRRTALAVMSTIISGSRGGMDIVDLSYGAVTLVADRVLLSVVEVEFGGAVVCRTWVEPWLCFSTA